MTLPLFLALHLVYGTLVGRVLFPRMRAEGEVLGAPLLISLVPVALVSAPVGAIFMRYSGGWFLHGLMVGEGNIAYERFHFGLLLLVILGAGFVSTIGLVSVVVFASRDREQLAWSMGAVAAVVAVVTIGLDGKDIINIVGTHGRHLWNHPTGVLSVAVVVVLMAWVVVVKRKFADVPKQTGPSVPKSPLLHGPL